MRQLPVIVLLVAAALAGCSQGKSSEPQTVLDPGEVLVQGVVVDEAVRPVPGAKVTAGGDVAGAVTTGDDGAFEFALMPGAVILEATHARYAPVQVTVQVAESVAGQEAAKVVLQFAFSAEQAPYVTLSKLDGYVVCSLGISVIFSEECGEGAGTPVGRVGKQASNVIRYDFTAENPDLRTVVVEQAWEPTSDAGKEMRVLFVTNLTCEPACSGESVTGEAMQGPSPLLMRADEDDLVPFLSDPAIVFSTYTLARNDASQVNVLLNQGFQLFVTQFYREPAPEGYSFVASNL